MSGSAGGWRRRWALSVGDPGAPARARLALLGDVHANAPALAAVLAAIDAAGIAAGACTGDLVMRGEDPADCIDGIRGRGWPCAMGNTDHKVATRRPRPADHPKALRAGSRSWTTARLSPDRLAYLGALPMVVRLDLAGVRVAVMHGGPDDFTDAVDADTPDEELRRRARAIGADVVVVGHVHRQMVRRVDGCVFVNPGSVGEAVHGDRYPRWASLEVDADGAVHVELHRVDRPLATVRQR